MAIRRAGSTVLLASGALLLTAGPAPAAQHRCPAKPRHSIRRGHRAEVYYASSGEITGCSFAAGRPRALGTLYEAESQGSHGIRRPVLAGDYVAFELIRQPLEAEPSDPTSWLVVVRNLATGRTVRSEPTGTSIDPAEVGLNAVSSLVVSATGSVAWIVLDRQQPCRDVPQRQCAQVHVADRRGSRIVAEAPAAEGSLGGIVAESLTLHGHTLSWREQGTRKAVAIS